MSALHGNSEARNKSYNQYDAVSTGAVDKAGRHKLRRHCELGSQTGRSDTMLKKIKDPGRISPGSTEASHFHLNDIAYSLINTMIFITF